MRLFCEGDTLTIEINLAQLGELTTSSKLRLEAGVKNKAVMRRIAYLPNSNCIPDGNGGFRPEFLRVDCYVEEPLPKEFVEEMIGKIIAEVGKEDRPDIKFQDALGAVVEALSGYKQRIIKLYERVRDGY